MAENESQKPEDVLKEILSDLQSEDAAERLNAITQLQSFNYSSEAIRNELEKLALNDDNEDVRKNALAVLDLPTQRQVRSQINKLAMSNRFVLINEINEWEKLALLNKSTTSVLRKRYDFDIAPPPVAPKPVLPKEPSKVEEAAVAQTAVSTFEQSSIPKIRPTPPESAGLRPTLTQILLSETNIKISLYLGAFFVVASAAILGAFVDIFRIPLLVLGTIFFGGLSVAIRKRLPQPSFALFIVFSFFLPITANAIENTLKLSAPFSAAYWVFISLLMALVWSGGTWLYTSRLFSVTAFVSFVLAFYRIGDIFHAEPEFFVAMIGIAVLAGLAGVWALKKWRDAKFALPLFFTAQLLQVGLLSTALTLFMIQLFEKPTTLLWNFASIFTWGFAFAFYIFSDLLFPFFLFPWLAAGALIFIPWLIDASFEAKGITSTLIFAVWGLIVSASSELAHRFEPARKYSLPIFLVSIPVFAWTIFSGFSYSTTLGFIAALTVAVAYGFLHLFRPRGWLWALALFSFIVAYFAFFKLPFIEKSHIFFGYQLLGLSLIFLLPDLILKNDLTANWTWRLPPRAFGVIFTILNFLIYPISQERPLINTAVIFGVYAFFFAAYAWRYNIPIIGYAATLSLTFSVLYAVNHFDLNIVREALIVLSTAYFLGGFALRKYESHATWRTMLEASGLILGSVVSLTAMVSQKENSGWFVAIIGVLFIIEMYSRQQSLFEVGAHVAFAIACYLILGDFQVTEFSYILMGVSLIILSLDILFMRTFKGTRPLELAVKAIGGILTLTASMALAADNNSTRAAIGFAIFTVFFFIYTAVQRKAVYGYIPAAFLPLTIFFALDHFELDAWLLALTGLAVLYFIIGVALRSKEEWALMLRNSALGLGTLIALGAVLTLKETGGWYALVVGLLFAAEMYLSRGGWFEIGMPVMFSIGAFLILRDLNFERVTYHVLAYSLVWILSDLLAHLTFASPRPLKMVVRVIGGLFALTSYIFLFTESDASFAATGFGIYTLLFLTVSLLYRRATLFYAFTLTLPLFVVFFFRAFDITKWDHPVIFIAMAYYAAGFFLRWKKRASGWDETLLFSGLGIGVIVSVAAPIIGGLDAAIPVAFAATLWAVEAFWRKNVWLAFPANGLYLLAYFIILFELHADQPQLYSMGAALLGMLQHYLLTRSESKTGAFIMGMVSQLVLLGTTYIQMVSNGSQGLIYFVVLFLQAMAVLAYGIFIRSRSLTFTPIFFLVISVMSVIYILVYNLLDAITSILMVGCTGILLLGLGIAAVLMRERITRLGERLSEWKA